MNEIRYLNDENFLKMLRCGFQSLNEDAELINQLNVFPVPDGDTGTNMRITYEGGILSCLETKGVAQIASNFARGSLFSARGNSGVLLSEYCRGFASAIQGDKITPADFVRAMGKGYDVAFEATIRPEEGTILTVARESYLKISERIDGIETFQQLFSVLIPIMVESVDNTPNLLKCLRDAGVIDSGGKGLLSIYEGFAEFALGKRDAETLLVSSHYEKRSEEPVDYSCFTENSTLDYGYCTEFLLQLLNAKGDVRLFDVDAFAKKLSTLGDSLIVTKHDSVVKVHIHTKRPYEPMEYAQAFGEFLTIKIENMALQHNSVERKKRRQKADVIAIAHGQGAIDTLSSLGKVRVIDGGPTMNASVGEILSALKENGSDEVILMPNNKNIFLSAKAAVEEFGEGKVHLISSTSVVGCYLSLSMMLMPEKPLAKIAEDIEAFVPNVHSCSIAKSSRMVNVDGCVYGDEHYLEVIDGDIKGGSLSRKEAFMELLAKIPGIEEKEVLVCFYGENVVEEEIEELSEAVSETYPYLELGFLSGGQEIYDYLLGYVE